MTAFDVAPSAVRAAERHPGTAVDYVTADPLEFPPAWGETFAFVFDALTVPSLRVVALARDEADGEWTGRRSR